MCLCITVKVKKPPKRRTCVVCVNERYHPNNTKQSASYSLDREKLRELFPSDDACADQLAELRGVLGGGGASLTLA